MPSGTVLNSDTGLPIPGVTLWVMQADGQSAEVKGTTGVDGIFSIDPLPAGGTVMFSVDGYDGAQYTALNASGNTIYLNPEGGVKVTATFGKNSWLWLLALVAGFLLIDTKKKK